MQTHHFYHRKVTTRDVGVSDATRLLNIARHSSDRDTAVKLVHRIRRGLRAISRGREREQSEAGYVERWYGLYRFRDRSRAIKYAAMSPDEARRRNDSIRDLEMEWAVSQPIT